MDIGKKIKDSRKARGLTQSALAGDAITRNMISRIESGAATPSLDTLVYIAERLNIPAGYLLSEDENPLFYEKNAKIKAIYNAFASKDYRYCIKKISELSAVDDELAYLLASSYFALGKEAVLKGSLKTAAADLALSAEYSAKTVFDTRHIESVIKMYMALATNIQSPLLEFDAPAYTDGLESVFDYEIFKYLTQDYEYEFKNDSIRCHVEAKRLIKERKYTEALTLLLGAAERIISVKYNSYLLFSIYIDIENCYKQLRDFENAYKYSSKRMSMLEGFKT